MISEEIDEIFDTEFLPAAELFDNNQALKALSLRMNKSIKEDRRVSWEQFSAAAKTPEEKAIVRQLEEQVKTLQALDFGKQGDVDYFPTKAIDKIGTKEARRMLMTIQSRRSKNTQKMCLHLEHWPLGLTSTSKTWRAPKPDIGESRLNVVIEAIEKEAKKQGASAEVASNLGNGLRSQFIASKKGGNTAGAVARRVTSAALLANPMNAILNIAEGVTAPIYQNGVLAWSKTLPRAVLSTLNEQLGVRNKGWISNKELGLDKDFMGEIANASKKAMDDAAESASWTKLNEKFVGGVDYLNKKLYKYSGVQTVNRMGQEILSNSAIQRGMDLANDGSEKALAKLRKHDGMRVLRKRIQINSARFKRQRPIQPLHH